MRMLLKSLAVLLCAVTVASVVACSVAPEFRYEKDGDIRLLTERVPPSYPAMRFAVFSDLHAYATALGTEGQAFEDYLAGDRKLLRESEQILEAAIAAIKEEDLDFVIVPGDLTKDGERASHDLCALRLAALEINGKPVYVVPGNHDILNPHAYRYSGDQTERVPNVTPAEFAQIHAAFGYSEALKRDTASLSYVVEPKNGLWLVALDSCYYWKEEQAKDAVTDGGFKPETLQWLEQVLIDATQKNKAVIAMLHHGVIEHYKGQNKHFGEYVLDDYEEIGKLLAVYGVRLVFTGHYHAQDITVRRWEKEGRFLFDIQTGSLVTYPNPYRIVSISAAQKMSVTTGRVTAIKSRPTGFPAYALTYIESGIAGIAARTIEKYGVKADAAAQLAKQVARAFVAHYAGDERLPAGQEMLTSKGLGFRAWVVVTLRKGLVTTLWQDLPPPDNAATIDLTTGKWE